MEELSPDWQLGTSFRRYLVFPEPLSAELCASLTDKIRRLDTRPYLPWYTHGGVVLVPQGVQQEKFFLLPQERICFARTLRDSAHEEAMIRVLRTINTELRRLEYERGLKAYSLGLSMCDDCGAHQQHRSRRLILNRWPVADGSACGPWQGGKYNQVYGLKEQA